MQKTALLLLMLSFGSAIPVAAAPAAEAVLFLTLSARLARPSDHASAVTANGELGTTPGTPLSSGGVALGRRAFRLTARSHDFEAVADGLFGQQIVVRFTAVLLRDGWCAVADYAVFGLAKPGPGRPFGAGSTLQMNPTGFSLQPGRQ